MKFLKHIGIVLISIIITLFIFYVMSWYSFGTLPTQLVFFRMLFLVVALTIIIEVLLYFIKKSKK